MTLAASPIRYPDAASRTVMTRRAWWLVGLNLLIPGSVQVLTGDRRLGRFGLGATLTLWTLAVLALVTWLLWPTVLYSIVSNSIALWVLAALLVFYAVLWVVLTLDTLRLVRLVKTAPTARPWVALLSIAVMVFVSGTAAYGAYVATTASGFLSSVFVAGPSQPPVDGRYNILLLGGDSGPDREGMRPDSMSLVSIDADTGQAVTIGLPRDFVDVPFPEDSPLYQVYPEGYGAIDGCEVDVCQLNSIYTEVELKSPEMYPDAVSQGSEPGIEGMRDAVEGITGLTVQYYVLIDMQGFEQLIDALGGIDINVETRIPIGGDEDNNGVDGWIEPGQQHLDGYHALWYGRARYGVAGGDYERMQRQHNLEAAILQQFTPATVLTKFQGIAAAGADTVKTDIPQSMLGYFVDLGMKTKDLPIITVPLTPDNGVDSAEDPDYDYVRQLIDEALTPVTAEPEEG
ncbi:LCP family protein required for cell wall assembly [Agromyces terreus]|uniref:LCP family protein required for cell wall assembly n=1 Tax=Agromyces terreus TaxID=424795 RepID=A0A9X2GY99_9MICO|nr:LCP family protein [Agromyces terreus]MCP2371280.1 LCP family protein required for cell wall assembly [Agromyces terreus]